METCSSAKPEIKFLGMWFQEMAVYQTPRKFKRLLRCQRLRTQRTEVRTEVVLRHDRLLLLFRTWYAFSGCPLDDLEREDKFVWTAEHQKVLEKLKKVQQSDLLLFDLILDIVVAADACDYRVGAVISHRFPNGTEKAIAHASKSLTKAEKN